MSLLPGERVELHLIYVPRDCEGCERPKPMVKRVNGAVKMLLGKTNIELIKTQDLRAGRTLSAVEAVEMGVEEVYGDLSQGLTDLEALRGRCKGGVDSYSDGVPTFICGYDEAPVISGEGQ